MNLIGKVKKTVEKEKLIEDGDNVLICVSGGMDSTALLYILAEMAKTKNLVIGLAHVNHLLRDDESERDQRFVEALARKFLFPCHVKRFNVKAYAKERGISLQHAGRDVRYVFFNEIALGHGYNKIAIAHNLDDQVETFILRVLKGSGIRGMASIPVKRGMIIRPFLNIYRAEIAEYMKASSISHAEDSSNSKTVYERNYVRKEIMPLMERLNPAFKEKICLLLQDIAGINDLFEKQAADFLNSHVETEGQDIEGFGKDILMEIDALNALDSETRFRVIAAALHRMAPGFIALREHFRLIEKVSRGKRPNASVTLPHGIRARRVYNGLVFTGKGLKPFIKDVFPVVPGENKLAPFGLILDVKPQTVDDDHPISLLFEGQGRLCVVDRNIAFINGDKIGSMHVRTFREGDRFCPLGMKERIKLKDFFISQKIPKEERRNIPILVSDDRIIWVVGYRIDEEYKIDEETKRVIRIAAEPFTYKGL